MKGENTKSLYRIYPGKLKYDTKHIESCSEIELFIFINYYMNKTERINFLDYCDYMISYYIRFYNAERIEHFKSIKQNGITKELVKDPSFLYNLEDYAYSLDNCLLQSIRFGTNIEYNPNGRINQTKEFKEWFNNWKSYISEISNEASNQEEYCYENKILDNFKLTKNLIEKEIEKTYTYTKKENIKQSYA